MPPIGVFHLASAIVLTKRDFDIITGYTSPDEFVKHISLNSFRAKYFSKLIEEKRYGISDFSSSLDSYLRDVQVAIIESSKAFLKPLAALDKLYDAFNSTIIFNELMNGVKPSILIHAGRLYRDAYKELNKLTNVRELSKILGDLGYRTLADLLVKKNSPIEYLLEVLKLNWFSEEGDYLVERLKAFTSDYIAIMMCLGGSRCSEVSIHSKGLTYEDLKRALSAKSMNELIQALSGTPYNLFSQMLRDLHSLTDVVGALQLSYAMYCANLVVDMYDYLIPLRYYVLALSSSIIIRTLYTSLFSGVGLRELKEVVLRWWPL
ncbi:MAG: hypothetical protein N3E36_03525 [Sulfolobales archaeon]|nr:hypothetical protein [Sulfolobales archaeon]MCX8199083.1 hypothetical protein [Sulfolobales archaeon]MDW8170062.1 hypothetical protein [Desulfurococcaceae archaeon]